MQNLTLFLALCITTVALGQQKKDLKFNSDTNLIEATYFHDNGAISQQGTFNLDRKLHGEWISYDEEGDKIAAGTYVNGKKSGKWLFWDGGDQKEVAYEDNAIASVNGINSDSSFVRNK